MFDSSSTFGKKTVVRAPGRSVNLDGDGKRILRKKRGEGGYIISMKSV